MISYSNERIIEATLESFSTWLTLPEATLANVQACIDTLAEQARQSAGGDTQLEQSVRYAMSIIWTNEKQSFLRRR